MDDDCARLRNEVEFAIGDMHRMNKLNIGAEHAQVGKPLDGPLAAPLDLHIHLILRFGDVNVNRRAP